ncbi:hypothetical protein EPIR_2751 [Erwinia piriflorinigrans CFBP 5888]|uniref:Uncharacterized protein n=1 Tax=Erwinia piriflorinigrans CFBP 5888 TaxID=1161919 RepID=V5ZAY6_9GAMM|nr:hypothetical protein EPIR_2751 [Erwinia piriflorinigrans CFBP 5888]
MAECSHPMRQRVDQDSRLTNPQIKQFQATVSGSNSLYGSI